MGGGDADTTAKSGDATPGFVALEKAGVRGAVAPDSPEWRRAGTAIVEAVPVADSGSHAGCATRARARDVAHSAGPDVRVGGQPAADADFIDAVYGSFPLFFALIAVTTSVLLARAFRSLLRVDPSLPARPVLAEVG